MADKKPYFHHSRTAPKLLGRGRSTAVAVDPITGDAQWQAFTGHAVVYKIFVFNPQNQERYFTFYNSASALDQGEAIIFPWAVGRRDNLEIEFPDGLFLSEGMWAVMSTNADVLTVDPADSFRVILTVRPDRDLGQTDLQTGGFPDTP